MSLANRLASKSSAHALWLAVEALGILMARFGHVVVPEPPAPRISGRATRWALAGTRSSDAGAFCLAY